MEDRTKYMQQIQGGIREGLQMVAGGREKNEMANSEGAVKSKGNIWDGLEEIRNGIEKIEGESISFEKDPWLWDWLTVMKSRHGIMVSAFEDFFGSVEAA